MKFIDKEGKFFGKINVIDLLAILLVILAVVFVGVKIVRPENYEDMLIAQYKVKFEKIRMQTVEAWKKNAINIVDAENKNKMGDIVSMSYKPSRELVQKDDGTYILVERDDRYDIILTINVDVTEEDKEGRPGYYTEDNSTYIAAGKNIGLSNRYAQTFGEIVSVKIIGEKTAEEKAEEVKFEREREKERLKKEKAAN